ncbi:Ribokinase-like protein [Xylariaceae sp. AK1471]|nr:Ribokinase-like protein [Xylariaceae sp. AK1471]
MSLYTPKVSQDNRPVFVSLGMVVLDELRFPHHHTVFDIPGGSGFYATLGARLFKANPQAVDVGCIVVAGYDLPKSLLHLLQSWQMTLLLLHVADKPCTRGLLQYEDDAFGRKTFSYVNPPLRPSTTQLGTSSLLCAASFHFLALPEDLEIEVSTLLRLREEQGISERPLIVWEPAPMGCDSVHLTSHLKACALVDVFSPNHLELGHLVEGKSKSEAEFSPSVVEAQAGRFIEAGIGPNQEGCAVIRSGEHGVLILSNNKLAEWLPAYYDKGSDKVVDPTGAGNTFLGAFAVGLQETNDPREASLRGSVAASYVLEQFGPPKLTDSSSSSGELWNGSDVLSRLQDFKTRISKA